MKTIVAILILWLGVVAATSPPPVPSRPTPTLDPYAIYERCDNAMRENQSPPYLTYVLHVDADHINISRKYTSTGDPTTTLHFGIEHRKATYRVWYRSRDGKSLTQDLGSGELAVSPPVPWSLDFRPAPAWSASPTPGETVASGTVTTDAAGKLLAEITIDQSRFYNITYAGMETIADRQAYHLILKNISGDPNDHALRDLLVDTTSFRALQAVLEVGQTNLLYGGRLRLRVGFSQVGPYWLNTEGTIEGRGHYAVFFVNGSYDYAASQIQFPQQLPDRYFRGPGGS